MIVISKEEAEVVRKECPEAHIRRTMAKKSKRHRYWVSEEETVLSRIAKMRGAPMKTLVKY